MSLLDPFEHYTIPLDDWVQAGLDWVTGNFRPFFQAIRWPVAQALDGIQAMLVSLPPLVILLVIFLIAWQVAGKRVAAFTAGAMLLIGFIGVWEEAMITLSLILTAVLFCLLIGIPLGIWAGRNDRFEAGVRPVLDVMQTCPGFVYLVPIVMLFGIGNVPGVIVTMFFALPPVIRLTSLGIRQVPESMVESAYAFGSSPLQVLLKIQMPLAIRSIMAGVNQTLMMSMSMVTIASMIAVRGLGNTVLQGIGRLDMGLATVGGISIILLAMILDRITQAMGAPSRGAERWSRQGPIGLAWTLCKRYRAHPLRLQKS